MSELILITGGAGFVGYHLTKKLLEKGFKVRILDNLSRKSKNIEELQNLGVEFIEGDIRDKETVGKAVKGSSYVFHQAAVCLNKAKEFPEEAVEVNLNGSLNIFFSAIEHGVKKVIYASTSSVYGQPEYLPMDEKHPKNCRTPYESPKLCAEFLLDFLSKKHNLPYITLRYFNVYGPKQSTDAYYTSVINTFIKNVIAGKPPVINGKGDQSMDFTHIRDVVDANIAAMESDVSGEAFNVCKGEENTIKQLAEYILAELNPSLEPTFIDREVFVSRRRGDNSKLKKLLGCNPQVSLKDGLKELVEDVKKNPDDY